MEAEPGAVLLQVVGVNGRHPLTQSLVSKIEDGGTQTHRAVWFIDFQW